MAGPGRMETLIGLDIGCVNTRVSVFGIHGGKYCLLGSKRARTEFGTHGHLAAGIHEGLWQLQEDQNRQFMRPKAIQAGQVAFDQSTVEQVGLILSAFAPVSAALFGLAGRGSLAAGLELAAGLPLNLLGSYGSADLADEPAVIEALLDSRPEILILTGGTDLGAESLTLRWVEVARLVCRSLPDGAVPRVFFAGNPNLVPILKRRLEPVCRLSILPNLQPVYGQRDQVPAQGKIAREVISISMRQLPGLQGLSQLAGDLTHTRCFMLDRMVRFITRSKSHQFKPENGNGVLALDLGAGSTMVSAGKDGWSSSFRTASPGDKLVDADALYRWTAAPSRRIDVEGYLATQGTFPGIIPQTLTELAMSQSLARERIRSALRGLAERRSNLGFDLENGLLAGYETVIASGSALTAAPTAGQAMLILLDSLQPWQETTIFLDRHHILPMLGLLGEAEPLLPVQVLDSNAFENLGTVIPVVSQAPEGVLILSVHVAMESSGKSYEVSIPQGVLRRLLIPPGETIALTLDPATGADAGVGPGVKRQIRVKSGSLGVVIDARGRPLQLPEKDDERIERLRHWLWSLGG